MNYYLGLDVNTDAVGYAATDTKYLPLKKHGEPMMGVTTFDEANTAEERRMLRTGRRRIDRKQQRIALTNEIFAKEILAIDPRFFIRRSESRLFREEAGDAFPVFNDKDFTDVTYYKRYPTIHHLIVDLMQSKVPHDVRLVYLAVAWLIAHRGHFLFDIAPEDVASLLNFTSVYKDFCSYFENNGSCLPWGDDITADQLCEILLMQTSIAKKKEAFKSAIYKGTKPEKEKTDTFQYSAEAIMSLLCGGKIKPEDVFRNGDYEEVESISLTMGDEDFARIVAELNDEDGELLRRLRALQDCALLITAKDNKETISEAQIEVYNRHKSDLALLKQIIRKYKPEKYNDVFRKAGKANYTAYSYNTKNCETVDFKKASQELFNEYLKSIIKDIVPEEADAAAFTDMKARIELGVFMPKQKNTDNRVIPQQLYRIELQRILDNAESYLAWLSVNDADGLTPKQKLLSIFDFRIPYFVGPLAQNSSHAWIVRKAEGKIYPWNFEELVDFDSSEEQFIRRMTNKCTYIAGADVLPAKSLLYSKFTVLNEINNLKADGVPISVELKQKIYNEVMLRPGTVTIKKLRNALIFSGIPESAELSGVDIKLTSSLYPYHKLKRLLNSRVISEDDAEAIITRASYSENKSRLIKWLNEHYPEISKDDCKYIAGVNFKNFGRLSRELLTDIGGCVKDTGEYYENIITAMWETNNNLMQLLSDNFTFREEIERRNREYYSSHPQSLAERLDEMYVSNSVKRPILRALDICKDVVKATGCAPEKIFIEMSRGSTEMPKSKKAKSRKEQLKELYKKIKSEEARKLEKEIEAMGDMADNMLQSDVLYLYYLQMGKCAYTGEPIVLSRIFDSSIYNKDHIYPQSLVKDDSLLNNKVLVCLSENEGKRNAYPVSEEIQIKMRPVWEMLKAAGLMTEEKYRRLTRTTPFTDEEKWGFINRQLVETRQSTKALATILKEKYPDTEIVYVKSGLVSEFRQEFDMGKPKTVNILYHAKDAYLNIVVGNVYNCRFTKRFFNIKQQYSLKTKVLFEHPVFLGKSVVWTGTPDIEKVRSVLLKNHIHVTRYAFIRKGGLFDQQPVKAKKGLVPLKSGMATEKYGGYNKPTASYYYLAGFNDGKKHEVMFVPVELLAAEKCLADSSYAQKYVKSAIKTIINKSVNDVEILMNGRRIKIGTVIEADGLRLILKGKSTGGLAVLVGLCTALCLSPTEEKYIKRLESFARKAATNSEIKPDEEHDGISNEANLSLYDSLIRKLSSKPFVTIPGNQVNVLIANREVFAALPVNVQVQCLANIISLFGNAQTADLSMINGSKNAGVKTLSAKLSNWAKKFNGVYLVDQSASGINEKRSTCLLKLLDTPHG